MSGNVTVAGAEIVIQADQPKPISPDLFGIFFEDINYAADGGLYAELIQNRSFEYSSADQPDWNFSPDGNLFRKRGDARFDSAVKRLSIRTIRII